MVDDINFDEVSAHRSGRQVGARLTKDRVQQSLSPCYILLLYFEQQVKLLRVLLVARNAKYRDEDSCLLYAGGMHATHAGAEQEYSSVAKNGETLLF